MKTVLINSQWISQNQSPFQTLYESAFPSTERMDFSSIKQMIENQEMTVHIDIADRYGIGIAFIPG